MGDIDDLTPCTYCGSIASTIDHVPPVTARDRLRDLGMVFYPREVPACKECNSALGAREPWTVSGRRLAAKKWIRRRYAKYLNIPDWTDDELATLEPEMRAFVESGLRMRAFIRSRLSW